MEDLSYLALIWSGVFISTIFAAKTKLTPVLYFLAFGAAMVNIGWLPKESPEFIRGFSEVGIILIMFALGFEENSSNFIKGVKRSWGIAFFGALAPFLVAYFITDYFWQDARLSMICGLAMTATAVSLTMVSLKSEGLQSSSAATGIMTSAVLDDVASLILVAIMIPVATGEATISFAAIQIIVVKALAFFVLVTFIGLWIFPSDIRQGLIAKIPFLSRYGIREILAINKGEQATLSILLMALLVSLLAHHFGFHPAIGAYMAGLILKEEYFHFHDHPSTNYYEHTKKIVDNVAFSWIGPVFFVELGTKLIFDKEIFFAVLPQTFLLTFGLLFAQIVSAALAARFTGKFYWHESLMIGFGMLGRAELAFVVLNIGYVQHSIISTDAFYTLMFTAFWLNVAVPVTIKLWRPYYEGKKQLKIAGVELSGREEA